jgi:hypothetical protein
LKVNFFVGLVEKGGDFIVFIPALELKNFAIACWKLWLSSSS